MKEDIYIYNADSDESERAVIVGVRINGDPNFERDIRELERLAAANNIEIVAKVNQNLPKAHTGLYIGTGKTEEVLETVKQTKADLVIFDNALTPMQLKNLQEELDMPVLDRTMLILDLFAKRAATREAKLQVESARLRYMLPRLVGLRAALGRQGGGSGLHNKGSGEKKIDLDKRKIGARIDELDIELEKIAEERKVQRRLRADSGISRIALVGYTNAGKSTLLNRFMSVYGSDDRQAVFEKDMLFATLDTTVRKISLPDNMNFILSDTVGFLRKLPHNLVKAFRSTLEEVKESDLLLHVVDYSDDEYEDQRNVTEETLKEIGADNIPSLIVYNKSDKRGEDNLPFIKDGIIYISAKQDASIHMLSKEIAEHILLSHVECKMLFPFDKGGIVSYLNEHALVLDTEYREDGILLTMKCRRQDYERYKDYSKL